MAYYYPLSVVLSLVGHVATLVRSHMNGLLPFENTIEQKTETMPLALK